MPEHAMIVLAVVAAVGVACQWLAWWLKLPAILLLLLTGLVMGPVTDFLRPDALFGGLLFPFVSLGVAVVLFEGSLRLQFHEIRELASVVRNLVTVGVLVNWLVIAAAAWWLLNIRGDLALLFGGIVVVTGPTVITPLLRTMRPTADIANVLRWEGIIIDPLGAVLALLVFEYIVSEHEGGALLLLLRLLVVGATAGFAGAHLLGMLLRRHLLPGYLVNVATLALVLGVFTASHALQRESGLLAVTVMGITLANMREVPIEEVVDFKESLSVMIISMLFIVLAARVDLRELTALGWGVAGLLAVILFLARPAAVAVATFGSRLTWRQRLLLAWLAPRGIVAAAVSALFALQLEGMNGMQVDWLVPLTFMVIIGTVVLHSATARPVAALLGVSEPEPKGVLILGAHRVARAIAGALEEEGFRTVLADTNWDEIRTARMEGLNTYFGSAVSEHADRHLDLVGIGGLLAMTRRPGYNALACTRFKREFGANRVFALQTSEEKGAPEKRVVARPFACNRLFGEDITLNKLASLLSKGAEIHTTLLTEDFDFETYQARYDARAVPLFGIDGRGRLRILTGKEETPPAPGWSVIGLLPTGVLEARSTASRDGDAEAPGDPEKRGVKAGPER